MNKLFFVSIVACLTLVSCKNYYACQVSENSDVKKNAVPYFLPKTVLYVDFTVDKTTYLKGPFASYSSKYTGISSVILENKTEFQIADVKISQGSVADSSKVFAIVLPKNSKRVPHFNFMDDGLLFSMNYDGDINNGKNQNSLDNGAVSSDDDIVVDDFKYFASENIKMKTDTVFEKIVHDTITIEKQTLQHSVIAKSMEDKAKDVADYLKLIAENKMNLLSGYQEVGYDINTVKFMYQELEETEEDYLCLFKGKKVEQTLHYRFPLIIDETMNGKKEFLLRFDSQKGVTYGVDTSFSDNNIYYKVTSDENTFLVSQVNTKKSNKGLYYIVPEKVKFVIENDNQEALYETQVKLCQFGKILSLPRSVNSVVFDPETSSLRMIK